MSTRITRAAKTRAQQRISIQISEEQQLKLTYRGDIPYINDAYFNLAPANQSTGDENNGIPHIASIPMLQEQEQDYGTYTLFHNEPNKILNVSTFNMCEDHKQYINHIKSIQHKYPFDRYNISYPTYLFFSQFPIQSTSNSSFPHNLP
eukprot:422737_1